MHLTETCGALGCTDDHPKCHRCGGSSDVSKRFVIDGISPCVSGTQLKVTGHYTHACDPCGGEYDKLVTNYYKVTP